MVKLTRRQTETDSVTETDLAIPMLTQRRSERLTHCEIVTAIETG